MCCICNQAEGAKEELSALLEKRKRIFHNR